jgi:UTP:GlnB (protein PII) uridylyltransferase
LTENLALEPLIARHRSAPPLYLPTEGERIPTSIRIDNDISDTRTVIDLETEDHPGLLHILSRTLTDLNVDISLARICTEKGAAIDTFYVTDRDGHKITDPDRQAGIHRALAEVIQQQLPAGP